MSFFVCCSPKSGTTAHTRARPLQLLHCWAVHAAARARRGELSARSIRFTKMAAAGVPDDGALALYKRMTRRVPLALRVARQARDTYRWT